MEQAFGYYIGMTNSQFCSTIIIASPVSVGKSIKSNFIQTEGANNLRNLREAFKNCKIRDIVPNFMVFS